MNIHINVSEMTHKLHPIVLFLIIYTCATTNTLHAAAPIIPQEQAAWASSNTPEELEYNIYFHMGIIRAKAGYGKLCFTKETDKQGATLYHGRLAGKSLSIVEHIMRVRDTLDCFFNEDMVPMSYRKGTHEGSYNAIVNYYYHTYWKDKGAAKRINNVDSTKVELKRWRKKGKDPDEHNVVNFSNKGVAYDMLSVFYSVRHLDYDNMKKGTRMKFVCYDGIKQQTINVEYRGPESCELRNEKKYNSHLIYLTFATKGQDETPLKVWLSKTPDHRPLKAIIGLKRIGSIRCEIQE